jgi:hypothetical protein
VSSSTATPARAKVTAPTTATTSPLRPVLAPLVVASSYLVIAFALFASTWGQDPFHNTIGHPGDSALYMWWFSWIPYALTHGINPFFTNFADYPEGVNLLWNAMPTVLAIVVWPVTATFGLPFAYNLMVTVGVALSATVAFVLIRRCVTHPLAATVGGLVYGFSPYMAAHSAGHVGQIVVPLPPLILLLIDEVVRVQRRHPLLLGVALALTAGVQFFISQEELVATGVVTLIALVAAAGLWPEQLLPRLRFALAALLPALAIFLVLVAYPVAFALLGPQHMHTSTPLQAPNVYVSDFLGFWVPTDVQLLAPHRLLAIAAHFTGNAAEATNYLGVPLSLLLLFVVLGWWRNPWLRVAALTGAVVAILSLGITLHVNGVVYDRLPVFILALAFLLIPGIPARALVLVTFALWLALWRLPLISSLIPGRLMLFGYLFAGLLLAVFVDALIGLGWARLSVGLAALAMALVPLLPRVPYSTTAAPLPAFFAAGGQVSRIPAGSVALVAPVTTGDTAAESMLWQATSKMQYRMPEGYMFVAAPPPANFYLNTPSSTTTDTLINVGLGANVTQLIGDERLRLAIRGELTRWNVRTVIVGPMANEDQEIALLTWVLGRPPESVQGVQVWWEVHDGG